MMGTMLSITDTAMAALLWTDASRANEDSQKGEHT